jgi:zinc transport system substrate-binding protein
MRIEKNRGLLMLIAGFAAAAMLVLASGCPQDEQRDVAAEETEVDERPFVKTTCYPIDWLVEELAGQRVRHELIIPRGEDPPLWDPGLKTVADLKEADLILANGAGYETWMETATLPPGKVVYTAAGLDLIRMEGETHSHGPGGEHSHSGTDPHTWTDPNLFIEQAEVVVEELIRIDPDHAEAYSTGLTQLIPALQELDEDYREVFDEMDEDAALAASHPSYNYLAQRYGFAIVSFGLDPQEVSSEQVIDEVSNWQRQVLRPVMFWEEPPTPEVQTSLPGNIRHVFVDPLEQPPEQGEYDYMDQAEANVERLREALTATD